MISRVWTRGGLIALAALGAVVIGVTLWSWGQPLICTCGYVQFWVGSIFSSGNSQHVADWYTLSHVVHGMLIVLVGRLFLRRGDVRPFLAVAIVTGVAWEILEHTDWVLDQFRAETLYQGYHGDTVLNAVSDYVWMLLGLTAAWAMPQLGVLAAIAVLEITATVVARDSLTLTTLMLIHSFDSIEAWQQEINPNAQSE